MTTTARLVVLWGTPSDPAEFDRHYRDVHIPLAKKLPGLRRYTVSRTVSAVRGGDPYYLVAELDFDDMASFQAAFQSPEGQATAADAAELAAVSAAHTMVFEVEEV